LTAAIEFNLARGSSTGEHTASLLRLSYVICRSANQWHLSRRSQEGRGMQKVVATRWDFLFVVGLVSSLILAGVSIYVLFGKV